MGKACEILTSIAKFVRCDILRAGSDGFDHWRKWENPVVIGEQPPRGGSEQAAFSMLRPGQLNTATAVPVTNHDHNDGRTHGTFRLLRTRFQPAHKRRQAEAWCWLRWWKRWSVRNNLFRVDNAHWPAYLTIAEPRKAALRKVELILDEADEMVCPFFHCS